MTIFQWAFAPLLFGMSAGLIVRLIRRDGGRSVNVFWALVWATAGLLVVRPDLTQTLAYLVGIGRGSDLVLYVAVIAGLFASLYHYRRHRDLEILLTELVRHAAMENSELCGRPGIEPSAL